MYSMSIMLYNIHLNVASKPHMTKWNSNFMARGFKFPNGGTILSVFQVTIGPYAMS